MDIQSTPPLVLELFLSASPPLQRLSPLSWHFALPDNSHPFCPTRHPNEAVLFIAQPISKVPVKSCASLSLLSICYYSGTLHTPAITTRSLLHPQLLEFQQNIMLSFKALAVLAISLTCASARPTPQDDGSLAPSACRPNFQGSAVRIVNPATQLAWDIMEVNEAGDGAITGFRLEFTGQPQNNYIIK